MVYIDRPRAKYGRMIMCHMLADTTEELLAMARRIGVRERHLQHKDTYKEHFDVCKSKRAMAVARGAVELKDGELGAMLAERRKNGQRVGTQTRRG